MQEPSKLVSAKSGVLNMSTDWGVSVSEVKARQTVATKLMKAAFYIIMFAAAMASIPVLAGALLFTVSPEIVFDILLIAVCVLFGVAFNTWSKQGDRNALQIDYAACEVRLGALNRGGVFVRHRVCPFALIDEVFARERDMGEPELCLVVDNERITLRFKDTALVALESISSEIAAARDAARMSPVRTRIKSTIAGLEAGYLEVGQRLRSRVVSRAA